MCKGMPSISLRNNKVGMAMIETVNDNFESYAKKEIEKTKLSCTVQSMVGHPIKRILDIRCESK